MKERIVIYDCARAICTLYIIGFWHLFNYLPVSIENSLTSQITYGALGCFLFISGLFLGGKNNKVQSLTGLKRFYKKRFWQIYPLFFLSCTSLYIANILWGLDYISGTKQFILTLLGISCIVPPAPATIWFISMLILLYLITPFINFFEKHSVKIIICTIIEIIICTLHFTTSYIDYRMCVLVPLFFLGLILPEHFNVKKYIKPIIMLIALALFVMLMIFQSIKELMIIQIPLIIVTVFLLFCISNYLEKNTVIVKVLLFISKGSMVAYLFHRQFFGIIKMVLQGRDTWIIYIIACVILFVVSYYVQNVYEKLIHNIKYS